MQLLNSIPKCLSEVSHPLLKSLEDIANNVEIQTNFCIRHSDYKPLELPTEVVTRFQSLPIKLQHKYLKELLQCFLYSIYYNGSMQTALASQTEIADIALPNLENNTFLGIDLEFCDRLHQSNCGEGYFDSGWRVVRQENDGSLAVIKDGLTLHIQRDRHLKGLEQSTTDVGDFVAIRLPKNLMENGYYVAVGNAGRGDRQQPSSDSMIISIYFHFTSEGAVVVMASLTQQLNEINIPFNFKVLYNPSDYNRYDSGVLYFERSHYSIVREVLQRVYAENQAHFQPEIPLFTKQLAAGLAVAEEPDQKFSEQESFGMNRCQIVANGLLETWHKGDNFPESRMNAIFQHFSLLGIDWQHPYLNAQSEDIYTPLD
jgi:HopA1 effector protein family